MRSQGVRTAAGVGLAMAGLLTMRPAAAAQPGISGRLEVRQVEAGYRPGGDSMRVRVHLVSGMAVEYEARGPDVDRLLAMIRIFSPGQSHMFVELEGTAIRAFQVSVP